MKKVLIALVVLVVVALGAVIALPFFIDVNQFKPEIEAKAKEALGRELKLNGPIKLSLWPNIGVEASDVRLANVPGGQAKEMASLKSLVVSVKLMPLLAKTVEVDSFVLNEPVINLEVDRAGKPNWQFGDPKAAARPAGSGGGAPSGSLKLGDVRLVNGKLSYSNLQTGDKHQLDAINVKISLPDMDSAFKLDGSAVWNKEKVDLDIGAGALSKLQAGQTTPVKAKLASKNLTLEFDGNATVKETSTAAAGAVSLDTPSIKDLAAWAGKPLQNVQPNTMGKLSIKGKLALNNKKADFTDAKIAVDAINATGALSVDANAAKPFIKGNLDVDKLDVNPYLGPEQPAKPAAQAGKPGAEDWSNDPIDVSALKTFDADLAASAGQVIFRKMKTGKATVKLAVKDGRMALDLGVPKPGLYQGEGTINVAVNAVQTPAAYDVKAKLVGLQAEPYLKDAQDTDKISGTLGAEAAITARGASQRQIVSATNGQGFIKFENGAVKGIDLAGVARQLGEVGKGAGSFDPSRMMGGFKNLFGGGGQSEKTDFSEFAGTFTIVNGVLTNRDLALKSPFVRVTGAGTVSLPPKTMDYKINIAAVATAQGQGGQDSGGVGIPVNCKGPWTGDSCKPDLAGMFMGDPSKLMKGLPGMGGAAGGLGGAAGGLGGALPKGMPGAGSLPSGMPSGIPGLGGSSGGAPAATPAPPAPATGSAPRPPASGGFGGFKLPGQ
ncbi:MAG: AsmA family protein [Rhodospirillales bacterium]